ncbi:ABC transporter permease [Nitratireductor aquimarinus]|uniref:ABC transporter permease n=1 Tax=Alphaproteobacteria TaxID=28211 RepID=UPI001C9401CC|nr:MULTISPECIES: ABC transporter permease [Alphaproteobacteria]MBY5998460.1 ABC transporter permease [Tritonibacter mobilis]
MASVFGEAVSDICAGLKRYYVWAALAREDLDDQHRRTTLGPLWMLLNYLLLAGAFIVVFGRGEDVGHHVAYVAIGLFVWFYCSELISRSVTLFKREESLILGTPLPITVYVMRLCMQAFIRACYSGAGCLLLLLFSDVSPSLMDIGYAVLGIALIAAITPAVVIVLAMAGAWFPDLQFIVSNLLRLGLFLTPIFWSYGGGDSLRDYIYMYNPFTWVLHVVRAPIIEGGFPLVAFNITLMIGLCCWIVAMWLLGSLRKKVVFVL